MQEPPLLHIESSFNEFVKEFNGELVSELLPANPSFDNADYLFRNDNVVAELKCLEKDTLDGIDFKAKEPIQMRWLTYQIAAVFVIVCVYPSAAFSQRQRKPSVPETPFSFNLSIEQVPIGYQGQSIELLYKQLSLRTARSTKREFETTEQHQGRLKQEEDSPILGTLTINDLLSLVVDKNYIKSEYNADARMLQVTISVGKVWQDGLPLDGHRSLSVESSVTDEGSYMGTNAYGAKVRVKRTKIDAYDLDYDNPREFAVSPRDALVIDIKMDGPSTAIKAKQTLRMLALVKLTPPYTRKNVHITKATFNDPRSDYYTIYYLTTRLAELWLYDASSGRIYAKIKPNTLKKVFTAEEEGNRVWVQLKDGSLLEVDEAWEQGDYVWYRNGNVTLRLERDQVKGILRKSPKP